VLSRRKALLSTPPPRPSDSCLLIVGGCIYSFPTCIFLRAPNEISTNMPRHVTLKGVAFGSIIISYAFAHITPFSYKKCLLYTLMAGLCLWVLYRSFVYPFYISPLRHIPTVHGRWAGLVSHLSQRLAQEMGAAERDWHLKHGPIVRYFILPLGVERLAVADVEALRDINLRYPYRFAKPQRAINWMEPVLGERGILLVSSSMSDMIFR
jgi:hypothetical protein